MDLKLAPPAAAAALLSAALPFAPAPAQATTSELEALAIEMVPVVEGLEEPVFVTGAPGEPGQLYVVEQPGRVVLAAGDGGSAGEVFLDLSAGVSSGGERGLLGLAFHPDYADNGRFFVNYTRATDGATVVSEFAADGGTADQDSERVLLVIEQPFANHNGGMIAFDLAGMLLIGTGDGGSGGDPLGAGQDPDTLLGKLLRIDVDEGQPYGIPDDNGFAASEAHRPEIHAAGLRNPWRFSVDPVGGHVYIGDVGQGRWEEVNVLPAGEVGLDFGWNEMEGPDCFVRDCDPGAHTLPVLSYDHGQGCSVVGGYAYRGVEQPAIEGVYLFGDFCSGTVWAADAEAMVAGEAEAVPVFDFDGRLVSFGTDAAGELYAVDQRGRILRVSAGS